MAGCQLAFGQWTRVTNTCECMVLVQFVPVGIRHMADSIFSRSLFSLVAIKAATFATYLVTLIRTKTKKQKKRRRRSNVFATQCASSSLRQQANSFASSSHTAATAAKMPQAHFDASVESPHLDVILDVGHPLANRVVDGFIKVGGIGFVHGATQEAYRLVLKDETNQKSLEKLAQRAGKEAVQWGLVAGAYSGVRYGLQQALGENNWKSALLSGALTGATLAITEPNPGSDRVVRGAITGGAIATAAEFIRNLTD